MVELPLLSHLLVQYFWRGKKGGRTKNCGKQQSSVTPRHFQWEARALKCWFLLIHMDNISWDALSLPFDAFEVSAALPVGVLWDSRLDPSPDTVPGTAIPGSDIFLQGPSVDCAAWAFPSVLRALGWFYCWPPWCPTAMQSNQGLSSTLAEAESLLEKGIKDSQVK